MQCKAGADHIQSLRDGRTVYIDGQQVDDVTTHPAFRNAVASAAALYDYQARRRKPGTDDIPPRRWHTPREPRLADAA